MLYKRGEIKGRCFVKTILKIQLNEQINVTFYTSLLSGKVATLCQIMTKPVKKQQQAQYCYTHIYICRSINIM